MELPDPIKNLILLLILTLGLFWGKNAWCQNDAPEAYAITHSVTNAKDLEPYGFSSSLNKDYTESQFIEIPLPASSVYSSYIGDGVINLYGSESYVRLIIFDQQGTPYPVFYSDYLFFGPGEWKIKDVCAETCILDKVSVKKIKVEIKNAEFRISGLTYLTKPPIVIKDKTALHQEQILTQVDRLNGEIKNLSLNWTVHPSSIAEMTWADKIRNFFGSLSPSVEMPYTGGFEFYKKGIFRPVSAESKGVLKLMSSGSTEHFPDSAPPFPDFWDWRQTHGVLDPTLRPFGWMTPVRNQGNAGTCGFFSYVGALEANIKLTYNSPDLDIDLSEQDLISCRSTGEGNIVLKLINSGVTTEECFPYQTSISFPCPEQPFCDAGKREIWKIEKYNEKILRTTQSQEFTNSIKETLIQNGPLDIGLEGFWENNSHRVVLVGYIEQDGRTIWIIKNSWGNWGGSTGEEDCFSNCPEGFSCYCQDGYGYLDIPTYYLYDVVSYPTKPYRLKPNPINPSQLVLDNPTPGACRDNDRDHFCFWGLGEKKPSDCPVDLTKNIWCADCPDMDDNAPSLGCFQKPCGDGLDNDGDGYCDSAGALGCLDGSIPGDYGCENAEDPSEISDCEDGIDNDKDGNIDFQANGSGDPGCESIKDFSEQNSSVACDDGIDNDTDKFIDALDPGCKGPTDLMETCDPADLDCGTCDNGIDDDGDSAIDMNDLGCADTLFPREYNAIISLAWESYLNRECNSSSAAVGNMDNDKQLEIVKVCGAAEAGGPKGGVFIINIPEDGSRTGGTQIYDLEGKVVFPVVLADINNDERMEIIVSDKNSVHVLTRDGVKIWSYFCDPANASASCFDSAPFIADLDENPLDKEIVVVNNLLRSTCVLKDVDNDQTGEILWSVPEDPRTSLSMIMDTAAYGRVIIKEESVSQPSWAYKYYLNLFRKSSDPSCSFECPAEQVWQYEYPEDVYLYGMDFVLGDINRDGKLELNKIGYKNNREGAFQAITPGVEDGLRLSTTGYDNCPGCGYIALANLDNEDKMEILIGGPWDLKALKLNDSNSDLISLWEYKDGLYYNSSPFCVDIDNDDFEEVLAFDSARHLIIIKDNNHDGVAEKIWQSIEKFSLVSFINPQIPQPLIADMNGDGRLEIVVNESNNWGSLSVYSFSFENAAPFSLPWPMFRHDPWGSNNSNFLPSDTIGFKRGDINFDGIMNISDAIYLLSRLFLDSNIQIKCLDSADVNDDGLINITDAVVMLQSLFVNRKSPPAPFDQCGIDQTPDDLTCAESNCRN